MGKDKDLYIYIYDMTYIVEHRYAILVQKDYIACKYISKVNMVCFH
jgi:hypothetical protein